MNKKDEKKDKKDDLKKVEAKKAPVVKKKKKIKKNITSGIIKDYMFDRGYKKIFFSGKDLNDSFMCMGMKV